MLPFRYKPVASAATGVKPAPHVVLLILLQTPAGHAYIARTLPNFPLYLNF
jgi:hypothetical protein